MSWQRRKTPKGLPKAKRHKPKFSFSMEKQNKLVADARADGLTVDYIIGIDEVAWGAIAGPLVLGCVVLKPNHMLGVKDSKAYTTEKARNKAAELIYKDAEYWNIFAWGAPRLDALGPSKARDVATAALLRGAQQQYPNSIAVIDGNYVPSMLQDELVALPKADDFIQAVAAASVVAKVARDQYMRHVDDKYEFYKNKGYPTHRHLELLKALGPGPEHRKYTSSVKAVLSGK